VRLKTLALEHWNKAHCSFSTVFNTSLPHYHIFEFTYAHYIYFNSKLTIYKYSLYLSSSSSTGDKIYSFFFFDVLVTVHLSIFISVFNQLDAQNLFHSKFYFMPLHVSSLCAYHQEVKITLHRGCIMQFWPPDDEHICSKHVEAWNKTYCETIFCIKLAKYWDK